jgi:hypothetical protein
VNAAQAIVLGFARRITGVLPISTTGRPRTRASSSYRAAAGSPVLALATAGTLS